MIAYYQDLLEARTANTQDRYIVETINAFLTSPMRAGMLDKEEYYKGKNPFLSNRSWNRVKLDTGKEIVLEPVIKIKNALCKRIIRQLVNRMFYNPIKLDDDKKKAQLGRDFDKQFRNAAYKAAIHGTCFGFWNNDQLEVFEGTEYLPLLDERTSAHMAGLRVRTARKTHVWLYEIAADGKTGGVTEWILSENGQLVPQGDFIPFQQRVHKLETGTVVIEHMNAPGFPIVPLYANEEQESILSEPILSKVNAYDAVMSGLCDNVLRTKPVYWNYSGFAGTFSDLMKIQKQIEVTHYIPK